MEIESLIDRWKELRTDRSKWERKWQEVADFVMPIPVNIYQQSQNDINRKKVSLSSVPSLAAQTLAHTLNGALTNPMLDWFKVTTNDAKLMALPQVRRWLDSATKTMHHYLNQSNFYETIPQNYLDLVTFGTTALLIEEDDEDLIRFSARSISELYVTENYKGMVDTVFRTANLTARQAMQQFGDKLPDHLVRVYEATPNKQLDILHVILPRTERDKTKIDKKNKPFASLWICLESCELIDESGYDEMPMPVGRWAKVSTHSYGYSPALQCMADIKMLNEVNETTIRGKQLAIAPPLFVKDDSLLGQIQYKPFGVTTIRDLNNMPKPLINGGNVNVGDNYIQKLEENIQKVFFNDIILTQDVHYNRTAEEVRQRTSERERILTSVLGRLQSDLFEPLITRVFSILWRKNVFDQAPPELNGKGWRPVWTSPLSRKMREFEVVAIQKTFSTLLPLQQAGIPVFDRYNFDRVAGDIGDILGVPPTWMFSDNELQEKKIIKEKAMQEQMQAEQMRQALTTAADIESKTARTNGIMNQMMTGLAGNPGNEAPPQ